MIESRKDPKQIAIILLKATALPDEKIYTELSAPKYTTVDYYRMACHLIFQCHRCGTCCTIGDPIRLKMDDAAILAKHFKIPLNKAIKKYTIPDPINPEVLNFKHIRPCKFFDCAAIGCKIYAARPWSCRIFPFLGIYGSENQVKVNESCPGSVETMKILTRYLEDLRQDEKTRSHLDLIEIKKAKATLRKALDSI